MSGNSAGIMENSVMRTMEEMREDEKNGDRIDVG